MPADGHPATTALRPQAGDALVIVDLQRDFFAGGALPVTRAQRLLPVVNRAIGQFQAAGCPIVATRDWHPADHCSFLEFGGRWPVHCVQGTPGAEFVEGLELPQNALVVSKGTLRDREAYSGFAGTELSDWLKRQGIRRAFVCGVATEYCVLETAKDAIAAGLQLVLMADGIHAADASDGRRAIAQLLDLGALLCGRAAGQAIAPSVPALLTDLYQLTMLQAYFDQGMDATAVFELFVRKLPAGRNFLIAAGLEQALEYLQDLRLAADELDWLAESGRFRRGFLDYLEQLRFTGDVHALPEGTVFFPHEPILRVTAPLPEAQFVESRLINILQFQVLIASKAARSVLAAPGRLLVDFGMRRAHGAEAALMAARAAYLVGFSGTATVQAGQCFEIPVYGTMAHSFIQAHDDENVAFEHFALSNPDNVVLLLDTYDTELAAEKTVEIARRLASRGVRVRGVRLDSGDLAHHARRVRRILDDGGLSDVTIFASGNLDEYKVQEMLSRGAPIDGFGIGSRLDVSADAPYLDCAYKLQEYAGRPRRKRSEGKATWPGRKQVYRTFDRGLMTGDTVTLQDDPQPGQPLLRQMLSGGRRVDPRPSLADIRQHAAANLAQLPPPLRALEPAEPYPVQIADALRQLAAALDQGGRVALREEKET